jgi:hypothetical protein
LTSPCQPIEGEGTEKVHRPTSYLTFAHKGDMWVRIRPAVKQTHVQGNLYRSYSRTALSHRIFRWLSSRRGRRRKRSMACGYLESPWG